MTWEEEGIKRLKESLYPIPSEKNGIDWKSSLSDDSDRLAKHISAFANNNGGGFFAFGLNNDASFHPLSKDDVENIVKKLSNIADNRLAFPIQIQHSVIELNKHSILLVYIPEQTRKPVHLRGKDMYASYWRSGGTTRLMDRKKAELLAAESEGISFEMQIAKSGLTKKDVLSLIFYERIYLLLDKEVPQNEDVILSKLSELEVCVEVDKSWSITNLGAILFARDIKQFPTLVPKSIVVRKYSGNNNRNAIIEQYSTYGYAVGFHGLIDFIMANTSTEKIDVVRENIPSYPKIAIRELVANALVHQDFSITGIQLSIEIFANKISITNAGESLNDVNRLIDLPPHSRNEKLAQTMHLLNLCERRGSGIDRAVEGIESMFLPAVKISKGEEFTRAIIYARKPFSEMTKQEKIDACYQHACLMYEDDVHIDNKSVRSRFNLDKNQSSVISRVIADTVEAGLIKPSEEGNTSKKFATYIPYYG